MRLFALVYTASADALIADFNAKHFFRFWRPERDPTCGYRREPRHGSGPHLDAAIEREPSRVPVRAYVLDLGRHRDRGEVFRHAQRHLDPNDEQDGGAATGSD